MAAKKRRFNMFFVDSDWKKLKALAKLQSDDMSTVIRSVVRQEYNVKIALKK